MSTVEELIERSRAAQQKFEFATQEQVDAAAKAICKSIYDNAERLGKLAVVDSRMGKVEDKISKCRAKSSLIWEDLKDKKSVGIIGKDEAKRLYKVAKPMGVVASIIPSTNPVVTPMSNAAFALKTRNSIIFAPHPRGIQCCHECVKLFREALKSLGFPEDLVLEVDEVSMENSNKLMQMADVIVATGGMGMVKAAYSSGKPAYGVGQGNVQCIVDSDADIKKAAADIVLGRGFDYGLICLGEQTAYIPAEKFDEFLEAFRAAGAYYVDDSKEVDIVRKGLFPEAGGPISRKVVGLSPAKIAEIIGLPGVPEDARVLAVRGTKPGRGDDLNREKMCPVINIIPYEGSFEDAVNMALINLDYEGKGHSVAVHSNTPEHVEYAALHCPVSRLIVNQPAGTTGGGSPTNGFTATTTLGCGSWGNNSFSGNFTYKLLMNLTRVGYPLDHSYLPDPAKAWED